jgi:hypothetical protein
MISDRNVKRPSHGIIKNNKNAKHKIKTAFYNGGTVRPMGG